MRIDLHAALVVLGRIPVAGRRIEIGLIRLGHFGRIDFRAQRGHRRRDVQRGRRAGGQRPHGPHAGQGAVAALRGRRGDVGRAPRQQVRNLDSRGRAETGRVGYQERIGDRAAHDRRRLVDRLFQGEVDLGVGRMHLVHQPHPRVVPAGVQQRDQLRERAHVLLPRRRRLVADHRRHPRGRRAVQHLPAHLDLEEHVEEAVRQSPPAGTAPRPACPAWRSSAPRSRPASNAPGPTAPRPAPENCCPANPTAPSPSAPGPGRRHPCPRPCRPAGSPRGPSSDRSASPSPCYRPAAATSPRQATRGTRRSRSRGSACAPRAPAASPCRSRRRPAARSAAGTGSRTAPPAPAACG